MRFNITRKSFCHFSAWIWLRRCRILHRTKNVYVTFIVIPGIKRCHQSWSDKFDSNSLNSSLNCTASNWQLLNASEWMTLTVEGTLIRLRDTQLSNAFLEISSRPSQSSIFLNMTQLQNAPLLIELKVDGSRICSRVLQLANALSPILVIPS